MPYRSSRLVPAVDRPSDESKPVSLSELAAYLSNDLTVARRREVTRLLSEMPEVRELFIMAYRALSSVADEDVATSAVRTDQP